ncbi:MAG: hypothetical protein M0005_08630 [Actinomycetota bacterium]|jgi:hypothetical protein|nr:hypothetical protein [Actinomycetota bacterium]
MVPDLMELDETTGVLSGPSPNRAPAAISLEKAEFCRSLVQFLIDFMSVGSSVSPHLSVKDLSRMGLELELKGVARPPGRQPTAAHPVVALPTAAGSFRVPPFVAGGRMHPAE